MRGCGRIERPAFPAPSDVSDAQIYRQDSRAHARRDREDLSHFPVVPAHAGTHNHKRFLEQKLSATVPKREAAKYGFLLSQERQRRHCGAAYRLETRSQKWAANAKHSPQSATAHRVAPNPANEKPGYPEPDSRILPPRRYGGVDVRPPRGQ